MNGYQPAVYETALKTDRMKDALYTESEKISVRWNLRGNGFTVWKKERPYSPPFVMLRYFHVSVKVKITQVDGRTLVRVSPGPAVKLKHAILFVVLTALILLFAGKRMGVDNQTIVITLGLITAFAYAFEYVFNRFPEFGYGMYKDIVRWLEHVLELEKVKE